MTVKTPRGHSLSDLPNEVLTSVLEHVLYTAETTTAALAERQRVRLCRLSLICKRIRAIALDIDSDLLVLNGNKATVNFSIDNASSIRRLFCHFALYNRPGRADTQLYLSATNNRVEDWMLSFRGKAEMIIDRLGMFRQVTHLDLQIDYEPLVRYDDPSTAVGNLLFSKLRKMPLFVHAETLRIHAGTWADWYEVDQLFWRCARVRFLDLHIPIYNNVLGQGMRPPLNLPALTELHSGGLPLDMLLGAAQPASCHLRLALDDVNMCCEYQDDELSSDAVQRTLAAPASVYVGHLIIGDAEVGFSNALTLEAEDYAVALAPNEFAAGAAAISRFTSLHTLTLGWEYYGSRSSQRDHEGHVRTRHQLIGIVHHLAPGLHLRKLRNGWSEQQVVALQQACGSNDIKLTWFSK